MPAHPALTGLTLVGASATGVAVQQAPIPGETSSIGAVFSGPEKSVLTERPLLSQALGYPGDAVVQDVVGSSVAWYERRPDAGLEFFHAHRTNVLTGRDTLDGDLPQPIAFVPGSWLSDNVALSEPPVPGDPDGVNWKTRPLNRYDVGSAVDGLLAGDTLVADVQNQVAVAADATDVLLATSDPEGTSPRRYYLDLVALASGDSRRLLSTTDAISSVALSTGTAAWAARTSDGADRIHQLDLGPARVSSSYTERDPAAGGAQLVAGKDAAGNDDVGYLVPDPDGTFLRVVTGPSARRIELPAGGSGLAAVGTRFLTATGGAPSTAGVYRIDGDDVTRVATIPTSWLPVTSLAFSASRLHYTDPGGPSETGDPGRAGLPVWQRTVSGAGRPVLSAETLLAPRAGPGEGIVDGAISFSAGRGSMGGGPAAGSYHWQLIDRGAVTGTVSQPLDPAGAAPAPVPNTSGPYTLVGGSVYRPDGQLLYSEPVDAGQPPGQDDIFGSRVILSRTHPNGIADIGVTDVDSSTSATNPEPLAAGKCDHPQPVSIWGTTAAWVLCDWSRIVVEDLTSRKSRWIPAGAVTSITLGEGTLAWIDDGLTRVLDLTAPNSKAVLLKGGTSALALDDHLVARERWSRSDLEIDRLPFGGAHHPRLIGTLAAKSFTPGPIGSIGTGGTVGIWAPEFDTSKPLTGVTLRITKPSTGRVVRTLTGSAPDGSIRDLVWDGRNADRKSVPAGVYRWALTARAEDGEGDLIGPQGARTISGTVELR